MAHQTTPKLRFPGFTSPWNEKKVHSVYRFLSTNSFSREKLNYNDGLVYNIHYGDIHTKFQTIFYLQHEKLPFINRDVNIAKVPSENYCQEQDLVIADASEDYDDIGKTIEVFDTNGKKILAGLHTFLARPDKSQISKGFGGYYFKSPQFRSKIKVIAQGTKVLSLSSTRLSNLSLYLPTIPEQQLIASFLTEFDALIQQLEQKQNLLTHYKAGSLTQIFNQELRFTDGQRTAFSPWAGKKLSDIYSPISTNSYSRADLNYDAGTVKNIHYGDIHTKFATLFDVTKETVPFINAEIAANKNFDSVLCKEGDLVLADASEDYADVGKCIELVNLNGEKVVAGLHTIQLRPDRGQVSPGFGGYLLESPELKMQIMKIAQGSKVYSISTKRLLALTFQLPDPAEQLKIVAFLSALDEQIAAVRQQIALTQQFKKGLLQQLFV